MRILLLLLLNVVASGGVRSPPTPPRPFPSPPHPSPSPHLPPPTPSPPRPSPHPPKHRILRVSPPVPPSPTAPSSPFPPPPPAPFSPSPPPSPSPFPPPLEPPSPPPPPAPPSPPPPPIQKPLAFLSELSPKPAVTGVPITGGLGCCRLVFNWVGAFAFLNVSGLTSDVLSVVLQQGDITANGEVVLVACGIIPAPACVPGNGSSAYALVPPLNATYSVADVFANVIDSTADPGYDSFYLGVYTAGQAHEPSLRPYLRGQIHSITPGVAGNVPSRGRC